MKNSTAFVALAAGLGQVTATGFGFHNAPKFNCPANTDNQCTEKQSSGFSWGDLPTGSFSNYGGFNWQGFTCEDKFSKRDELLPRTFQNKCITGNAQREKHNSPSFGCDANQGIDKTSIGSFQVTPEFDCDLEFHYDMPDGSTCKHRSSCKKTGTTVYNTQCGGAKNVTVVYPHQPSIPKETCSFGFHSISFDCNTASSTVPASSTFVPSTSSVPVTTTSSSPSANTTPFINIPTSSATPSSSVPASTTSTPIAEETSSTSSTSSTPIPVLPSSYPISNTSSTSPVEAPVDSTTTSFAAESTSTYVTSFMTTSTIYNTVVSTVTSCAETVTDCPADSTAYTTLTVAVSTTVCPVTETHTSIPTPVEAPATTSATSPAEGSSTSPAGPVETLPCPSVVPSCLNTWMFSVGCKDNTDTACFCPDSKYVDNVYSCLYSYGANDDEVSEAISYFKGICAPYVSQNPAIATGDVTITTIITPTATTVPSAVYTTIMVTATTVVPCTEDSGETIPGSSSTVTINTVMTVPQVAFTTVPNAGAEATPDVVLIPGTVAANPVAAPVPTAVASTYPVASGVSTFTKATGTISYKATPTPTGSPIATAGAGRLGSGLGLLGFAMVAVAAF